MMPVIFIWQPLMRMTISCFGPWVADYKSRWKVPGLEFSEDHTQLALSSGKIYMWDPDKHSLFIYSAKDGSSLGKIDGKEPNQAEPLPFDMKGANSFTIDTDGTMVMMKNNLILRYTADGERIAAWGGSADPPEKRGFFKRLFGGESVNPEDNEYPPDVDKMKNRPEKMDTEYSYVTLGWDGYIYFMEATSSDDASVAKYDRNGE